MWVWVSYGCLRLRNRSAESLTCREAVSRHAVCCAGVGAGCTLFGVGWGFGGKSDDVSWHASFCPAFGSSAHSVTLGRCLSAGAPIGLWGMGAGERSSFIIHNTTQHDMLHVTHWHAIAMHACVQAAGVELA